MGSAGTPQPVLCAVLPQSFSAHHPRSYRADFLVGFHTAEVAGSNLPRPPRETRRSRHPRRPKLRVPREEFLYDFKRPVLAAEDRARGSPATHRPPPHAPPVPSHACTSQPEHGEEEK